MPATRLARRVITHLAQAEACESNSHLRDDLKIARLIVAYAASGEAVLCSPHVLASYRVLGLHPDKVWPAILARRKALGPLEVWAAPPIPKKPAQAVPLWFEKTNGARAVNSCAGEAVDLCDQTISVPMAAPSINALYPNPDAPSSAKNGEYSYEELLLIIARSGAPEHVRQLSLDALEIRGRWPKAQGPVTPVIAVSIKSLQDKAGVWRSTIQRRIQRARRDGYWRKVRDMNSWLNCPKCGAARDSRQCPKCPHRGNGFDAREFRRTFTDVIDVQKFESTPPCRQVREIRELRARHSPKGLAEMPRKVADATPEKVAARQEPVRKTAEHQRSVGRALGPNQRRELADRIDAYEHGRTAERDVNGYLVRTLTPGHFDYIKPLPRLAAVLAACESMDRGDDKWGFTALRIPKARAIEAAMEMGEVIPRGGSIGSP